MGEKGFEQRFDRVNLSLREALRKAVQENDVNIFYSSLRENTNLLAREIDHITLLLQKYLLKEGLSRDSAYRRSVTSLRKASRLPPPNHIHKDVIRTFKVRNPIAFENLISLLAKKPRKG